MGVASSAIDTGVNPLEITGARFTGAAADDFLISASTCDRPVRAGAACTLWVRFAPQESGTRTAQLVFDSNPSSTPRTVSLTGIGGVLPQGPAGSPGPAGPQGPK